MKKEIEQANIRIKAVKANMEAGKISYDQAKALVQIDIDILNKEGRRIAKEFGRTFHPITFSGLMR